MPIIDSTLFWFVFVIAVLAAWIEYRQRSGWAPILVVVVIVLAFIAHVMVSML